MIRLSEKALSNLLAIIFALFIMITQLVWGQNPPTVQDVYDEIKCNNIEHDTIVLRQAMWESGWAKCKYCSYGKYNNLFGFRHVSHITKDNPKGYIKFDTWQESVWYYKYWQDELYSGGDYLDFLNCLYTDNNGNCKSYAEGDNYTHWIMTCKVEVFLKGNDDNKAIVAKK